MSPTIVSPEGQSATFVELFFDLVFVFGVTQLVGLLVHELTWAGAGRALLVFWMVWWAWTQFTWTLNAADTTHPGVELLTLTATAIAFFMAVAVPGAFGASSLWFAVSYAGVRVIGLALQLWVTSAHPGQSQAAASFAALSVGGLATAVLGGFLGGPTQLWLWGMTIFLDVVAAMSAGQSDSWHLHAEHFAERHGLITIIALGESLIVAAGAVVEHFEATVFRIAAVAVVVTCGLWWTYFPLAKPRLEAALEAAPVARRGRMARDAFSLGHFPMLCGIIAYAVGLEEALLHPAEPLSSAARLAIALGLFLFVGGTGFAKWRAECTANARPVLMAAVGAIAIYVLGSLPPIGTLSICLVVVAAIALSEELAARRLRAG